MRDLTKSMMTFPWAISLFGVQQAANLMTPSKDRMAGAAGAFDAVSQAAEQRLDGWVKQTYKMGNAVQQGAIDLMMMRAPSFDTSAIMRAASEMQGGTLFQATVKYAQETGLTKEPLVRNQLAQLQIELDMGRFMVYKVAWMLSKGGVPNYEAAMAKCFCTEVEQRIAQTVSGLLGDYAVLLPGSPGARLAGRAAREYLYAPAYTIQGGTSNVLRNIMAIRGLGLQVG